MYSATNLDLKEYSRAIADSLANATKTTNQIIEKNAKELREHLSDTNEILEKFTKGRCTSRFGLTEINPKPTEQLDSFYPVIIGVFCAQLIVIILLVVTVAILVYCILKSRKGSQKVKSAYEHYYGLELRHLFLGKATREE